MEIVDTYSDTRRITYDLSFLDNVITSCKGTRWVDIAGQFNIHGSVHHNNILI